MGPAKFGAVSVGTLVLIVSMWFGLLTVRTNPVVAVAFIAVGIIFALYTVAGFARVEDPFGVGFKASLFGMLVGIGLLIAYQATGNASFVLIAPATAAGVGGSFALPPLGERGRGVARQAAVVGVALMLAYVFRVDEVLYAIFTPLAPFPVLLLADHLLDRAKSVVEETDSSSGS
jgi:hypothetical protein